MVEVRRTETFVRWLAGLKDFRARTRIVARLDRLAFSGNVGDQKSVGGGVHEMRIDYGAGYRLYYVRRGKLVVILLCGGDKRTQSRDIKTAQKLASSL